MPVLSKKRRRRDEEEQMSEYQGSVAHGCKEATVNQDVPSPCGSRTIGDDAANRRMACMLVRRLSIAAVACGFSVPILMGCSRSDSSKSVATSSSSSSSECIDSYCFGDVLPKYDLNKEEPIKIDGVWYFGPKEFFSAGINGGSFMWWHGSRLPHNAAIPPSASASIALGEAYDPSIAMYLRTKNVPQTVSRTSGLDVLTTMMGDYGPEIEVRPGLSRRTGLSVASGGGSFLLIAKNVRDVSGRPLDLTCFEHAAERFNTCGSGFYWRQGIWVGVRVGWINRNDWPEIAAEIVRVLELLRSG